MLLVSGARVCCFRLQTLKPTSIWIANATIISPENLDHIEKGNVLVPGRPHRRESTGAEGQETRGIGGV